MWSVLLKKIKESMVSVLPVVAIVFVLNLTPLTNFTTNETVTFLISAVFLIIGIGLFNMGADMAMTPMGAHIGSGLTKLKSIFILLSVCFAMGILITVAEPDLSVLAGQVSDIISSTSLILTIGVGVGLFLVFAILKIIFRRPISSILMFFYMMLFALTSLLIIKGNESLIPLAFDSGGVTTGPITVPFIMALGVGIASAIGGKNSGENSFGLIALCSVGPMLAVLLLGTTTTGSLTFTPEYEMDNAFISIIHKLIDTSGEVGLALGLIVVFFVVLQLVCLKLPKKKLIQIAIGIAYTFVGLVIFLSAVSIGFMPIGYKLGCALAKNPVILIIFGFIVGMVVVLAEPAVHVLNKQVEEITEGTVSRHSMMIALSIGVGASIGLSTLRIVFGFSLLYYLIPGYLISLGLSLFVPGLYTAIAFDSGGVASGPLTSSFILPFAVGACVAVNSGASAVLTDAFGIVAMVAMAPLITIQLLGFRAIITKKIRDKIATNRILNADDEQIIDFM
ncbi:MAG: DUF1538 domain-containing protein [Ruminococcaceae bacterium]|nr:DUF1538 domain-containing protein [Oscillospiraceae bacterium]